MSQVYWNEMKRDDSIIPHVLGPLSLSGFDLQKSQCVLDFGCGAGEHVAAFRHAGYSAYGVDIGDYLPSSCTEEEKSWFRRSSNRYIYEIPWPDQSFDLIYSNQVLEHLMYYEPALEEMRRVLKPEGLVLHIFPSKWRLIEPHFFCPLGSWIRWWPWIKLWSLLGTGNPTLPAGLPNAQKAEVNWRTSRTHLAYYSLRELKFLFRLQFGRVRFAEEEFVRATLNYSRVSRVTHHLAKIFPPIFWLYRHFHTKVIILDGYNTVSRAIGDYFLY